MGLESGTFISDLNANNPVNATDQVGEGDDHIRLVKSTILNTFPSITGAVSLTHTQINNAAIKSEANVFTGNVEVEGATLRVADDATETNALLVTVDGTDTTIETRYAKPLVLGYNTSPRVNIETAVELNYSTTKRFATFNAGQVNLYSDANTDTSRRRINFCYADGTLRGLIGHETTTSLDVWNQIHGGSVRLRAEDSVGTTKNVFEGDPDDSVYLYYAGLLAAETTADGFNVYGNSGDDPMFGLYEDDGTTRAGFIQAGPTNGLRIRSEAHGAPVSLQGEDAGGVNRSLIIADPDGPASFFSAGTKKFATDNSGGATLFSSASNDTSNRFLAFAYQDGTRRAFVGHSASNGELLMRNEVHGFAIRFQAEDAGGTNRNLIVADPDASVSLHQNGSEVLRTADRTAADVGTGAEVLDGGGSFRPVGFNVLPQLAALDSGNDTLALDNVGMKLSYNSATARSLFANNDGNIPAGAAWSVVVGPSGGTLTLDGGTGVTIRYWNGSSYTTTSAAGNITLGEGRHFIEKLSDTSYQVDGPNIS